jgi:hypothetical protein
MKLMKKHLLLLAVASLLALTTALAQPLGGAPEGYVLVKATNSLPRFDLDFHGGTPKQLVDAVEKAMSKPLNTVIPEEYANTQLPALSVKSVNVAQLFDALRRITTKDERSAWTDYINVNREPQTGSPVTFYYSWVFHSSFETEGTPTDSSIWCFRCETPAIQHDPTICRFYQLAPYLGADYKVEDITTAIETGWKMLGVTSPPKMSYHKETKVLIAVGEADKLKTIDDVLKQLPTAPKEKSSNKDLPKSKDQ